MSSLRRFALVPVAVAFAVGLAGCDADRVGAAAVVDGDRFTVSDLQAQVEQVQRLDGFDLEAAGGMAAFQRVLLTRHIQHEIVRRLAKDKDIEVSEADIDEAIDKYRSQAPDGKLAPLLAQSGYTNKTFRSSVSDQLIIEAYVHKTGADQTALTHTLTDISNDLKVDVNPRYGTWGEDLAVADVSGSISEPVNADQRQTP